MVALNNLLHQTNDELVIGVARDALWILHGMRRSAGFEGGGKGGKGGKGNEALGGLY